VSSRAFCDVGAASNCEYISHHACPELVSELVLLLLFCDCIGGL